MTELRNPADVIAKAKSKNMGTSMLQFPVKELGPHCIALKFREYRYQSESTLNRIGGRTTVGISSATTGTDAIILPLPMNISDTFNVRINGSELGIMGDITASAMDSVYNGKSSGVVDGMIDSTKGFAKNLGDWVAGSVFHQQMDSHGAAQARQLARRTVDGMGLGKPLDVATGYIVNPHMTLMFDGMDLKAHTFQWQLAPKNAYDSEAIKNIVNTIKRNILPSYDTNAFVQKGLMKYPSVVDIAFFGIESDYFMHYKTCMVQSFTADYTPNGLAMVKGGKPAFVNLSLQLMETGIHTAEDYE